MNCEPTVNPLRIGFGGDRQIAVEVLKFLISQDCLPECLVVAGENATHDTALRDCYQRAGGKKVFKGREFFQPDSLPSLQRLDLDFLILVHLQYKIPAALLNLPRHGVLNLHPAYLPGNRGWHTPTWAILDQTKYGATLHFMNEDIDAGDIVHQRELAVEPFDTADSLYQKALSLEYEVFCEAWPSLVDLSYCRVSQPPATAEVHRKRDLEESGLRVLKLEEELPTGLLIRRLRALTTSRQEEACYFEEGGQRYWVQVKMGLDTSASARNSDPKLAS